MRTVFIILSALLIISCNENRIYEEHQGDFPNYGWKKSKVVTFKPQIQDTDQKYNISLAFRHISGFPYRSLHLNVDRLSPSGETQSKNYVLQVVSKQNEYISDCAGDFCDLEVLVSENVKFEDIGTYTYNISHLMDKDLLSNVIEIGLVIDKVPAVATAK